MISTVWALIYILLQRGCSMASQLIDEIRATSDRATIYYSNNPCNRVFFDGFLIWEKDIKEHSIPDLASVLTRTGGGGASSASNGRKEVKAENTFNYSYYGNYGMATYYEAVDVSSWASYSGIIDISKLENTDEIKSIVVHFYGNSGTKTYNVSGTKVINVSDYASGSDRGYGVGYGAGSYSRAGVAAVSYKYV